MQMVDTSTKTADDAEALFKSEVEKLQKNYEALSKAKDAAVESAATPELRIVKQVRPLAKYMAVPSVRCQVRSIHTVTLTCAPGIRHLLRVQVLGHMKGGATKDEL
jgi:hypothetical protein